MHILFGIPMHGAALFYRVRTMGTAQIWRCFCLPRKILAGEPIDVFNHGHHTRDFTYVDDIVEGMRPHARQAGQRATAGWDSTQPGPGVFISAVSPLQYRQQQPGQIFRRYIEVLEETLGIEAKKNMLPLQAGRRAGHLCQRRRPHSRRALQAGYTDRSEGIANFVRWYKEYYEHRRTSRTT